MSLLLNLNTKGLPGAAAMTAAPTVDGVLVVLAFHTGEDVKAWAARLGLETKLTQRPLNGTHDVRSTRARYHNGALTLSLISDESISIEHRRDPIELLEEATR